MINPFFASLYF